MLDECKMCYGLCFIALFVCFCQTCFSSVVYRYNTTAVSWHMARQECFNKGGNLVNESDAVFLFNCTTIQHNENFWIGQYETFSSWIQIYGCYNYNESYITGQNYSEGQCAENCGTFFGRLHDSCFCLSESWSPTKSSKIPDEYCRPNCTGNLQCNNMEYMSVYKISQEIEVTDRDDETNKDDILCGLVECTNTGWRYFGYSCNQSLPSICNDGNTTSENKHWLEGQSACWNLYNSFLIGVGLDDINCNVNVTIRAPYWVGLYRNKITRDEDGTQTTNPISCFHGELSQYSLLTDYDITCQSELPFICRIETSEILDSDCAITTETTSTSTETSTSTTETTPSTTETSTSTTETSTSTTETSTSTTEISTSTTQRPSTTKISPTTSKDKPTALQVEGSNNADAPIGLGIGIGLGIPLIAIIVSVISHFMCGQRPMTETITEEKEEENEEPNVLRNKEEFYIRPDSANMEEINPRYSLFDDDITKDPNQLTSTIVNEQSKERGFSTFVTINKAKEDDIEQLINQDDLVTKL